MNIIVAVDKNFGIGSDQTIPWNIPEDREHFKRITTTVHDTTKINAVIMGRKTWESLPNQYRPLPGRLNIIISNTMKSNSDIDPEVIIVSSFDEAIAETQSEFVEQTFVIGGEQVYLAAINSGLVEHAYFTHIAKEYQCNTFFPIAEWTKYRSRADRDYCTNQLHNITHFEPNLELFSLGINVSFTYEHVRYNNLSERAYLALLNDIISNGDVRKTRNGTVRSLFGPQLMFDLQDGFPLLTTKRMFFRGIVEELLFFIRGQTDANILSNKKIRIWDANTTREFLDMVGLNDYEEGDMGPMYGFNWRHFGANYKGKGKDYTGQGFDQLADVIQKLRDDPTNRRIMMTTFDPSKVQESVLAPCHGLITQFYVRNGHLDCKMFQRSVDSALGLPFNIASYALLVHILSHVLNFKPGRLYMTFGDTHIYEQHVEALQEQLERTPYQYPELVISKLPSDMNGIHEYIEFIESLEYEDFVLNKYVHHSRIKLDMVA